MSFLSILTLLMLWSVAVLKQARAACDLCFDGEPISKPEYVLDLTDPVPIRTCGDLAGLLLFVDENDEACTASRAASTLCGCPNSPPDACTICAGSGKITKPLQNLDGLVDLGVLGFFGIAPTCALVDSGIRTFNRESDSCLNFAIGDLQLYCGCSSGTEEGDHPASDVCTLCPGGEIVPDFSDYAFAMLELDSDVASNEYPSRILCRDAERLVKGVTAGSELCEAIQRGSTGCGCPVPDNACQLCPGGGDVRLKTERVDSFFGPRLSCSSLLHQLHRYDALSTECLTLDDSYAATCGCDKEEDIVPCAVCSGGEPVAYPDKYISGVEGMGFDNIEHTCGTFEKLALLIDEKDPTCKSVQTLAKVCGCAVPENSCSICQDGASFDNPLGEYVWTYGTIFLSSAPEGVDFNNRKFSCKIADSFLSAIRDSDAPDCYWNQLMRGTSCGCSGSINWKAKGLMWTQRCSGILSLIGLLTIIIVVLTRKVKDRWNTYNQLILSISVFDALSSIAFVFGSALTPAQLGLYGSIGNEATCSFQGWLFQVGIISVYYSVVLCIYFILIVKYSWTERKFKKVRKWVHLGVLTVGISMSVAVIPFVAVDWRLCYVTKPPILQSWLPLIFFFLVPVGVCLLGMAILLAFFVKFVREVEGKTSSSRFSREDVPNRRSLTARTLWQSVQFLAVFYAVWPIQFVSLLVPVADHNSWLYFLAAILGPLQGFLNALVFFCRNGTSTRRRIMSWFGKSWKGSTSFFGFRKEKQTGSSHMRWNYDWAGKHEPSKVGNCHEANPVPPYLVEPTSEFTERKVHFDETSEGTRIDPLRVVAPEGCLHRDSDGNLSIDENLFAKTSAGSLQGDEQFEGEAILEYAMNAGLLDESDCKFFHKSISLIEISQG